MQTTTTAPDDSTTGRHLPALDGVRGIAVILVLLRHLFVRNPFADGGLAVRSVTRIFATGWIGVDLFFVLSGFLITGILFDTRNTPHFFRNFYARRALRIFPLYYGLLLVLIAVSVSMGYHWYPRGTLYLFTYFNSLQLQGVGATDAPWINLNHTWSLQIEEQFYLVWPLSVYLLRTRKRIAAVALGGVALSFLVRCGAVWSGVWRHAPYALYSWTPGRLDGLLLGAALSMVVRSRWRAQTLRAAPAVFAVGVVLIALSMATIHMYSPTDDVLVGTVGQLLYAITFAALLAVVLPVDGLAARLFAAAPLRFFGTLSYGLYVYHWVLHGMFDTRLHDWFAARNDSKLWSTVATGAVELVVSVAVAWASFRWFEQPILQLKRHFTARGSQPALRASAELGSRGMPDAPH